MGFGGTGGGGGSIAGANDAAVSNPAQGQILTYDGTVSKWKNAAANGSNNVSPTSLKTSAYSAAAGELVLCDATAGTFSVSLPASPIDGTQIGVKKMDNSGNLPLVATGGADVFEPGTNSFAISTQYRSVVFQYKASNATWYAVAMYLSVSSLNIPNAFTDLAGNVTAGQLPAQASLTQAFTNANYATVSRPTARTDISVMWIGDATTTSTHLPTNRIAGDVILTKQV